MSLDIMTCFGECTQGFTRRLQPLTVCEYDVDCGDIADLRDDVCRQGHAVTLHDLGCAWMSYLLAGKQAPSWLAVDRMRAAGHSGIIVPSFVPGATALNLNIVLWQWGPHPPDKVTVYDPGSRLPKSQLSWPLTQPF